MPDEKCESCMNWPFILNNFLVSKVIKEKLNIIKFFESNHMSLLYFGPSNETKRIRANIDMFSEKSTR